MSNLKYSHQKRYDLPRNKYDLAMALAKRYARQELENPRYQGKTEVQVRDSLFDRFRRDYNIKQLYKFYLNPEILKKSKPSKLEKDIDRIERQQNTQQSLF